MLQRYVGCGRRTRGRVGTAVFILWLAFSTVAQANVPPEITTKPQNQQVRVGGIAHFYCNARGDPPPVIHWKKNGKRVSGTQTRYYVREYAGGAMLRIDPIRYGRDDATYECVAENGVGDAVNAEAILSVFDIDKIPSGFPLIQASLRTQVLEKGQAVVLTCAATGNPSPRVRWLRDSIPLDIGSNSKYTMLDGPNAGALQITNTEEEDTGKYECVAENSIGTEYSKPTQLYVKVRRVSPQFTIPPPPVTEVMLGSNLTLQCIAVGSPMPYVKWRKGLTQDLAQENKFAIGKNVLNLYDIRESANYTCIAASTIGVIEKTTIVKVQSLPAPPTNVRVSEITANSVRLTWSFNGPEDTSYVIQFKPRHGNQAYSEISDIITMHYSVRNLSPYTEYELFVIAVNAVGRGPPSAPAVVTTSETDIKEYPISGLFLLEGLVYKFDDSKKLVRCRCCSSEHTSSTKLKNSKWHRRR